MKKRILIPWFVVLLVFFLVGCSDNSNTATADQSTGAANKEQSAGDAGDSGSQDREAPPVPVETTTSIAPWNKGIVVNGANIEIGCTLGEFRDATGFDLTERLNSPSQMIFSDGHSSILVYITPGWSEEETDYSNLFVGLHTTGSTHDATLSDFDTSNSSVILDGGITIGSTLDEMLAAYGEPDFTYGNTLEDGTETEVYNYPAPIGESGYATIEVDTAANLVYSLYIYHEGLFEE